MVKPCRSLYLLRILDFLSYREKIWVNGRKMLTNYQRTYLIPESVVEDTMAYRDSLERFLAGDLSPIAFRSIRVPMGIYEQRESDTYMIRVRVAGGVFSSEQAIKVAELAKRYGSALVHVTTRQDLQIHQVRIEDTADILEQLLDVGLSTRGGGGNTVRNVSACPFAGFCPDEVFDVTPYAVALTEYLIQHRSNFNLPRKFKAALSGCSKDCALACVADLGFFAHENNGERGFAVYAGGGMGAQSALGVLIEEFVPVGDIYAVAEAIKRVFDSYGDRSNRNRARLRYVVERLGADEFRRLYRSELEEVRKELPVFHSPSEERLEAKLAVRVLLPRGEITSDELIAVADLARKYELPFLRTTQDQTLLLPVAREDEHIRLREELKQVNPHFVAGQTVRCIACAGASTCKLGLCLSRNLARAIEAQIESDEAAEIECVIRISGCPNACGQHPIAPIGLFGSAVRVNGRLVPHYTIVAGGRAAETGTRLARVIGRVPAKAVPALMQEFFTGVSLHRFKDESIDELLERWGIGYLGELCRKHAHVPSYQDAPDYYRDFGCSEEFSLAGRGPGECGAGVMDVIRLDLDEARSALNDGRLYEATLAAARSLLVTRGLEPKSDRQVFAAFSEHLITPGWVQNEARAVLDAALDFRLGDRDNLDDVRGDIAALVERVELLAASLDSNLNFRADRIGQTQSEEVPERDQISAELDLRGVTCPMSFVRAKVQLEQMDIGQVLDILLDDGEPVRNVPASFAEQGQEVLSITSEGSWFRVSVRRAK